MRCVGVGTETVSSHVPGSSERTPDLCQQCLTDTESQGLCSVVGGMGYVD